MSNATTSYEVDPSSPVGSNSTAQSSHGVSPLVFLIPVLVIVVLILLCVLYVIVRVLSSPYRCAPARSVGANRTYSAARSFMDMERERERARFIRSLRVSGAAADALHPPAHPAHHPHYHSITSEVQSALLQAAPMGSINTT